jgi:hypothetical protein
MFLKSFMYESQTNAGGYYQVQSGIDQRFLKASQIRQLTCIQQVNSVNVPSCLGRLSRRAVRVAR